MQRLRIVLSAAAILLAGCSKSGGGPQVFLPHVLGQNGEDLDAARAKACDPSKVDLTNNILTQQNFQAMYSCANYDHSLTGLETLFNSPEFPDLLNSINAILKSGHAQTLHDTLQDWFQDGPGGTSKIDRLLPYVASVIKNPAFQDFLPVFSNILQSGRTVWADLLPSLADVVYTDLFPDNLENAFVIFNTFSGSSQNGKQDQNGKGGPTAGKDDTDYARAVKSFANFLKMNVDGETAARRALELADRVRDLQPDGTSLYQFGEHMLEFGAIDDYFLNSGVVRGEVVDPKLNESPDDPSVACPGLNDTPEQRQECANERLWKRPSDGTDAPITQLAGLVVEFQRDHSDMLPELAAWFSANGDRVSKGLGDYVVRAQVVTNLSKLNVGNYLQAWATKNNIDTNAQIDNGQLADYLQKAFTSADFAPWVAGILPSINKEAFGEKNATYLANTTLPADIASLYATPDVAAFAKNVIPDGSKTSVTSAFRKFNNKHRTDALQITFHGNKQSIEKHLGDLWVAVVKADLGEDVVLNYVIKLAQTLFTQMANDFKDKGQPLSEWIFDSPYGNPATTEMITGYAIKELDLLTKYNQNKDWLMNDFTNEVFNNDDDKRAFRLLLDQVPNIVLYVRSGMSRSGGDLTRALAKDTNGYLVKTYVKLIVKATQTGWVRDGARLLEAYHASPDYQRRVRAPMGDDIQDRRDYKLAVEAMDRIVRSLIEPTDENDYGTTTLSRLLVPVSSIVGSARRAETEHFLLTSSDQLLALSDQQINDFFHGLHTAKPPGEADERRASYKAVADMMRNKKCPDMVSEVSALFQENAVRPALNFLAQKIDDGSLPKVLLFIRRLLGFAPARAMLR